MLVVDVLLQQVTGLAAQGVCRGGPVPVGQHLANLRRRGGLGKDPKKAAVRAEQLAAIDEDWNCPWPLNWQRHYRVLADLVDADGVLPYIAPGVTFDGDDIGTWRWQRQKAGVQAQLMPEQRKRLAKLGIPITKLPETAPTPARTATGSGRGRARRRQRSSGAWQPSGSGRSRKATGRYPGARVVEITVDGGAEPVPVRLGVWISNTKSRRDKLTAST
ncbi:helicase associated domain-containing protein [Streptomyces microflavus]|uniref:helicase associated domain-containing protein n=1 Tax=Streptomyces microflavus TaxID=1919 RepID=UPI0038209AC4